MGSGGGGPKNIGDIHSLIRKAKEELQKGAGAGKRNVFISFAYEDISEVNLLRGQAKNENVPLEFNDWSVSEGFDSDRAAYIKQKIRERIEQSSVTIVFLSSKTAKSSWVNWEIDESLRQGKGVIAMYSGDKAPKSIPDAISKNKIRMVPWKHETLMKEIDRLAKKHGI